MSQSMGACAQSLFAVDADGWIEAARRAASPNFDRRPDGELVSLIVIHAISLPPARYDTDSVERFFLNSLECSEHPYFETIRGVRVSAHFFIRRDGELIQFVSCNDRAWHAGVSLWQGRTRCNDFSIGIELEGCDEDVFEAAQYDTLTSLLIALKQAYPVVDVVGHSDIAPGRKTDPGPGFDWHRVVR